MARVVYAESAGVGAEVDWTPKSGQCPSWSNSPTALKSAALPVLSDLIWCSCQCGGVIRVLVGRYTWE